MDSRGPLAEARKLCERAAESWDPEEGVALAHRALGVSEKCADAWLILARDEAATPRRRRRSTTRGRSRPASGRWGPGA